MATELIQAEQSVFSETSRERQPRDDLRRRIGCAVVESALGIKMTPLQSTVSDRNPYIRDSIDAAIGLPVRYSPDDYIPSLIDEDSLTTGLASAHVNYLALQAFQLPGLLAEKERNWRNHDRFKASETDGRLTRTKKAIGRNAILVGGGAAFGSVVGGYGALVYERLSTAFDNDLVSRFDSATGIRTTEVNLTAFTTDIYVGGHYDGTGFGIVDLSQGAGIYNPNAHNVQIQYSAQMGMLTGEPIPMNVSDAEAAANIVNQYNNCQGGPVRIIAFSQGTQGAVRALNEIAATNGGVVPSNVEVIIQGGPSGALGFGKSNYNGLVSPFLDAMGIETTQPIPPGTKVTVRTDIIDVFGNGGNQSGAKLLEMAVGPGHRVVGPENAVLLYCFEENGVKYEVYGDPQGINDPLLRVARDQGFYVSPQAEAFMEAVLPTTPYGAPTQYANATAVTQTGAALIDDTIKFHTGIDSVAVRQATNAIMTPERTRDLQAGLNLQRIPDQLAQMGNDPSTIPQNMNAISNEVQDALHTVQKYIPSENNHPVVDIINDGLHGAGINMTIKPPKIAAPVYHAPAPVHHTPTPAPVYHAPAPAPKPAPVYHEPVQPAPAPKPIKVTPPTTVHVPSPEVTPPPKPAPVYHAPKPISIPNIFNGSGAKQRPLLNLLDNLMTPQPAN